MIELKCKSLVDPSAVLSYDDAMIKFKDRFANTIFSAPKPITQSYECMIVAMPCFSHSYVYSFSIRNTVGLMNGPVATFRVQDNHLYKSLTLITAKKLIVH